MNAILKQAREVYKNRETEYYLETIRKTADELERLESEHEALNKDVARYFELASGKYVEDMQVGKISWIQYTQLDDEEQTLKDKLSKVGKGQ